jgi:hypothetical protein
MLHCVYDRRIMLKLPIWLVTEHIKPSDPADHSETALGSALAFSTSSKLFKFMNAHLAGEWKMQMAADRDGLVILIADIHRIGITTLALDPEMDGTGGEQFALADLVAFADSLR